LPTYLSLYVSPRAEKLKWGRIKSQIKIRDVNYNSEGMILFPISGEAIKIIVGFKYAIKPIDTTPAEGEVV